MQIPLRSTFSRFFSLEASSGILLAIGSTMAFLLANSTPAYEQVWAAHVMGLSLRHWVNDGLMTFFFFVVGLEIKRELVSGELASLQKAAFPMAAALGGMIAPALVYFFHNPATPESHGWGIPMATDIAFAVAVLSFFGKRVPFSLKIFLLALAIVDDLGAVLVIALFYTKELNSSALLSAAFLCVIVYSLRRGRIGTYPLYWLLGGLVWLAALRTGVHATVAGVLMGFLTPMSFVGRRRSEEIRPVDELIALMHPYVSYGIMPLFALANAGVSLTDSSFAEIFSHPIYRGVFWGLFLGKPAGIFLASLLAVLLGLAAKPALISWKMIFGTSILGGIGFTMSLFISSLALPPELEIYSKSGILLGSCVSGVLGALFLQAVLVKKENPEKP